METDIISPSSKLSGVLADLSVVADNIDVVHLCKELNWAWTGPETLDLDKDADTLRLRIFKSLDSLDHQEFRAFIQVPEKLLHQEQKLNFNTFSVVAKTAELISERSGFFLSSRTFPKLQSLIHSRELSEVVLKQLDVLRTQVLAQLIESDSLHKQPLGELLLELLVLHGFYELTEDPSHDTYNVLIKIARHLFVGLSFQQVMRLCHSINKLLHNDPLLKMFIVQEVESRLSSQHSEELITQVILLKEATDKPNQTFQQLLDHIVTASRLSNAEIGRLTFLNAQYPELIPGVLHVASTKSLANTTWGTGGPSPHSSPEAFKIHHEVIHDELHLTFSRGDEPSIKQVIPHKGEVHIDQFSLLYRADTDEVAVFPLLDNGLFISDVQLHYKGNNILNDISINVRQGEMVAIVGPSGCGKSTLLTMLAGMLQQTGGDILFQGQSIKNPEDFSKICTYIPQDDILFRELTVHEAIKNSLQLKVKGVKSEQDERLKSTIDVLGLERTEFLKIGNEGEKGISGGQRKRVNIGTTIVADMKPILLFDEPTSGLDPATDVEIMQLLRQLSRQGHIVMVVTHNLSSESLAYFDQLMVLDKTGHLQFLGKEKRARYFFNIRSTHLLFQKMKEQTKEDYSKKFTKTPEHHALKSDIQSAVERHQKRISIVDSGTNGHERRPGMWSNFYHFLEREIRRKSRDTTFLAMCLLQPILISVFISWNFDGPMPNAIFSLLAATLWIGAISGVREINTEMPQLKRDYLYGTTLSGYLGSKVISCFGFSAFQVIFLASILFWSEGYLEAPFSFHPVGAYGSLLLLNLFGVSLGLFMSAAIRSALAAVGLLPVLLIPLLIMGGALIRHNQVDGFQWLTMKMNPLRITYESLLFSGQHVLSPSLKKLNPRDQESALQQSKTWMEYLNKKELFERDPKAYQEQFESVDVNDLFSAFLSEPETNSQKSSGPSQPVDATEPELLQHRPDLWLKGHTLLPVDPTLPAYDLFDHYAVRAPKAFSDTISAQGMTGMFETKNKKDFSIYRPIEYGMIPLIEILLLQVAMFLILLVCVNRKN